MKAIRTATSEKLQSHGEADRQTNRQTEKLQGMKFKITKNLLKFICNIIQLEHISGAVSKFPKAEELRFKTKSDGCVSIL
jgi:hypothetical protein